MKRRSFCKTGMSALSAVLPFGILKSRSAFGNSKPNVLFIATDQQSIRAMSCMGNPYVNTPHMDSIANNGVLFHRSYCTAPVCGPSRSSWQTGMMPHQTGVDYNGDSIHEHMPAMGSIFRDAGYHTGWAGKWHLPESYPAIPKLWLKNSTTGSIPGFEMLPIGGDPRKTYPFGDFSDDLIADSAIEFMTRKRDKPFLLGVSLHNPHDICYQVMGKLIEDHPSYRHKEPDTYRCYPPLPRNFEPDPNEPEFISLCRIREKYGPENTYTQDWDETRWRIYLYEYYRMTERADRIIGRILTALRRNGLEENTLIVFTSDHGEGMAAHKWVVKLMLYDEVVSVPFAIQWKGMIPADVNDKTHFVSGTDILPTMCDYSGVRLPKPVEGTSLRSVIDNPNAPGRDFIVTELASDSNNHTMTGRMVRTSRYKYIAFSMGRSPEMFFDLSSDPGETKNRILDPSLSSEVQRHRKQLQKWINKTNDDFEFPKG